MSDPRLRGKNGSDAVADKALSIGRWHGFGRKSWGFQLRRFARHQRHERIRAIRLGAVKRA